MEYSKLAVVKLNGVQVLQANEADFEVTSNDSPVHTLAQGLAGFSDGAAEATINCNSGIPSTGVEVDWQALALDHVTIELSYLIAGQEYVVRGRVMRAGKTSRVNQPNGISMSFHGRITRRPTSGG